MTRQSDLRCLTVRRGYLRVEISQLSGVFCSIVNAGWWMFANTVLGFQVVVCVHVYMSISIELVVLWFVASKKL